MTDYARRCRFGVTPWERYRSAAAVSIAAKLDREKADFSSRDRSRLATRARHRGPYRTDLRCRR